MNQMPMYPVPMIKPQFHHTGGYQRPEVPKEEVANLKYESKGNRLSSNDFEHDRSDRQSSSRDNSFSAPKYQKDKESSSLDNRTSSVGPDNTDSLNQIFKVTKSKEHLWDNPYDGDSDGDCEHGQEQYA